MNIKEKILELINGFEDVVDTDIDDLIKKIKNFLNKEQKLGTIKQYAYELDTDVFDSPGLDIYYLSLSWVNKTDELEVLGYSYYSS